MIIFAATFGGLLLFAIIIQLLTKMKIVTGNELGVLSGTGNKKGFRSLSGGRMFIIPLLHRFAKLDLTPHTIEVLVESAIANGIVPLNVKATVSFAIASNEAGRARAVTRILTIARDAKNLRRVASDIIEGHLRDSIASMTPEQVMMDKDALVAKMINVCKMDLENIGLEITTMNIADVDDHRLKGVDEPDLYIALLKRIQTTNAETKARIAQAEAKAAAVEQQEQRRAEVTVRSLDNEFEDLQAATRVNVKEQKQIRVVGVEEAQRDANAKVAGLKGKLAAEEQAIEMLMKKHEAEIVTPALAEKDRMILTAKAQASKIRGKAEAEINQLKETLAIINKGGASGIDTYLLENFDRLIAPFAETMEMFPVDKLSIITGAEGQHQPISAIHPNAIDAEKNNLIGQMMQEAMGMPLKGEARQKAAKQKAEKQTRSVQAPSPADLKRAERDAEIKVYQKPGKQGEE